MKALCFKVLVISLLWTTGLALSSPSSRTRKTWTDDNKGAVENTHNINNILILDHLNINHEKGKHDWLKAFYVEFLRCALDPRKAENVASGKKTIWVNIGAQQFHLPEGKPNAQVLDGLITLAFPDLTLLKQRFETIKKQGLLQGSLFVMEEVQGSHYLNNEDCLVVHDPWGNKFRLVQGDSDSERDSRGTQPGELSEGLALRDLTIHTPPTANLSGIGRFYEQVLNGVVVQQNKNNGNEFIKIQVGPMQTLTFQTNPTTTIESHVDLKQEDEVDIPLGSHQFMSNYGPHVSLYVADLSSTYERADELGLAYVNPRFKRRAYTLDQALDDCMFRCLDIVDPENTSDGPIIRLEHEIRSVVKRDGSKYKSCPFDEIPPECVSQDSLFL